MRGWKRNGSAQRAGRPECLWATAARARRPPGHARLRNPRPHMAGVTSKLARAGSRANVELGGILTKRLSGGGEIRTRGPLRVADFQVRQGPSLGVTSLPLAGLDARQHAAFFPSCATTSLADFPRTFALISKYWQRPDTGRLEVTGAALAPTTTTWGRSAPVKGGHHGLIHFDR